MKGRVQKFGFSLRSLQVFMAVEEAGSMAAAAERLSASPSAISQQITNLEAEIGTRLFDRAARPIALTPAGLRLRHHAQRILEAVSDARADLMELNLSSLPTLRVAIIDDLDASITPELVARLKAQYPQCAVVASSGMSNSNTRELVVRDVDIAVTAELPEDVGAFDVFPLLREPFILVTARGALNDALPVLDQLRQLPMVAYNRTLPIGLAIETHLRRIRFDPSERYTFSASRSIFAMVDKCGGWALTTPLSLLDSERFRGALNVHPLPFSGFSRTICMISHRDELGHLPAALADVCRELFSHTLVPSALELAPWTKEAFQVLDDSALPMKTGAIGPD